MGRILAWSGVLAAAVLLCAASPDGDRAQRDQSESQKAVAESLQSIAASLQAQIGPDVTASPCSEHEEKRDSDLCAQWKAADAAYTSAVWAGRSFWIGLFTLLAACAAAAFAALASHHTRRAANYASDSHQAFVNAEDASLVVSFHHIGFIEQTDALGTTHSFSVRLEITNVGRSAARINSVTVEQDCMAIFRATLKEGHSTKLGERFLVPATDLRMTQIDISVDYSSSLSEWGQTQVRGFLSAPPPGAGQGQFLEGFARTRRRVKVVAQSFELQRPRWWQLARR